MKLFTFMILIVVPFFTQHVVAQTLGSRIVAKVSIQDSYIGPEFTIEPARFDSERYVYSYPRSNKPIASIGPASFSLPDTINYDTSLNYPASHAAFNALTIKSYDANNRLITRKSYSFDTLRYRFLSDEDSFAYFDNYRNHYNFYIVGGAMQQDYDSSTFDFNNCLTSSVTFTFDSEQYIPVGFTTIRYDPLQNMTEKIVEEWNTQTSAYKQQTKLANVYAGKLLLQSTTQLDSMGTWINSNQTSYLYDASARVIKSYKSMWNCCRNYRWDTTTIDSNVYDIDNSLIAQYRYNKMTPNLTRTIYSYDDRHNLLSDSEQYYDQGFGYHTSSVTTMTYNEFNQITSVIDGVYKQLFYYQTYFGVPANGPVNSSLRIFPVPANGSLNIDVQPLMGQLLTVKLIDLTGRTVKQWDPVLANQALESFAVGDAIPGCYILQVITTGQVLENKVVIIH